MNENHELTIQRIVDDEMDGSNRADFLQFAERHPELYRELALAFIEDQVWCSHAVQSTLDAASVAEAEAEKWSSQPEFNQRTRRQTSWWNVNGSRMMFVAAGVLFALSMLTRFDAVPSQRLTPTNQDVAKTKPSPDNIQMVNDNSPVYFQSPEGVNVPLSPQLNRLGQGMTNFNVPADLQRQLMDAGYRVQPNIKFITGRAPDGRSYIVPVQQLRIKRYMQ